MATEYKTFLSQEMLSKGFLASTVFYSSVAHSPEVVDAYLAEVDKVFERLAGLSSPSEVKRLLNGPVSHVGFKRIN
jgi:hypothetical protein